MPNLKEQIEEVIALKALGVGIENVTLRELSLGILALIEKEVLGCVPEKELPKGKCINAENHLFGSCFECKKIEGWNDASSRLHSLFAVKEL